MSKADISFVKSVDISYAAVADVLRVSRQAVSRGVQREGSNYFAPSALTSILGRLKVSDPIRFEIARRSVAELYPDVARRVFSALDSRQDVAFDSSIPGDFTLVTADFVGLAGKMTNCRQQIEQVMDGFSLSNPGMMTVIVNSRDREHAERFRSSLSGAIEANQRIRVAVCEMDLSLFPTCLMRIDGEFNVGIFVASDGGFTPISSTEADRIRHSIERIPLEA